MAKLKLLHVANDLAELRRHVQDSFLSRVAHHSPPREANRDAIDASAPAGAISRADGGLAWRSHAAAALVLNPPQRVRAIPAWRLGLAALAAQLVLVAGVGTWLMSTDDMTALASALLQVHPLEHVDTSAPDVGLVVRTSSSDLLALADRLAQHGVHVSFADGTTPSPALISDVRALGDDLLPAVPESGAVLRWVKTSPALSAQARALGLRRPYYFLAPRHGLLVGQLILAKTAGATPVYGTQRLTAGSAPVYRRTRAGDILVIGAGSSASSAPGIEGIASGLAVNGLGVEPLSSLTDSGAINASSSGERASVAAAATSAAKHSASGIPWAGVAEKLSSSSNGASATGITV
jgi:hypothetical protein